MPKVQTDSSSDWIGIVKNEFEHPAIVLWRAVELKNIDAFLHRHTLEGPILDIGCAEGKITSMFFEGKSVVGLDNCWELIKENRKSDTYKALVLADACAMPYKDKAFGSIFSNCVIEHIPDLDSVLRESGRVIKDGGIFLFSVPSHKFGDFLFFTLFFKSFRLGFLAEWYKRKRNKLLNHFHCYDHNRWRGILGQNGFRMVEYKYYLSKSATCYWDFMAAVVICIKYIWPLSFLGRIVNKWLNNRMSLYYNKESKDGSGLLILAEKGV